MPTRARMFRWIFALVALVATAAQASLGGGGADPFPVSPKLRPAVDFWTRVYIEIDTGQGFIHDSRHLGVVYEAVRLTRPDSRRHRARQIKGRKAYWRKVLTRLAKGGEPRDAAESQIIESFTAALGREPTKKDLHAAGHRLRFQLGQRDKFEAGLIRAGAYEDEIRQIFRDAGLPEDLAYLPHVESSFNTRAWSKYGAAGMWQFMPGTGRRFMEVNYVLDERMDPLSASVAAAKLLAYNESVLGTWPLALTAYNHGVAGMKRAVKKVGTRDMAEIVWKYKGRAFGFASRNFYAQFLAARTVASEAGRHFGPLERHAPFEHQTVDLPFYVGVEHVERYLDIDRKALRRYNPALRRSVYDALKRIPKGYALKLPPGTITGDVDAWLARVPAEHRHGKQLRSTVHVVRRGETLSAMARRHRTTVATIVSLNGLRSANRIWPGQRLELLKPKSKGKGKSPAPVTVAKAKPKKAPAAVTAAEAKPKQAPAKTTVAEATPKEAPATTTIAEAKPKEAPAETTSIAEAKPKEAPAPVSVAEARPGKAPAVPEAVSVALLEAAPTASTPAVSAPTVSAPAVSASMSGAMSAKAKQEQAKSEPPARPVVVAEIKPAPAVEVPAVLYASPGEIPTLTTRWQHVDSGYIRVGAGETLGHFADWLEVSARKLRRLNGLSPRRPIRSGQRLQVDFSKVSQEEFVRRRVEYHATVEARFLERYRIAGLRQHELRRGENLWVLATKVYDVPDWLIHRYNPDTIERRLIPGTSITIPVVEVLSES